MAAAIGNNYSGNSTEWRQALRRAMARRAEGDFRITLAKIADVVVEKALAGEREAWQEIGLREDGKPNQSVSGPDGGAVEFVMRWASEQS